MNLFRNLLIKFLFLTLLLNTILYSQNIKYHWAMNLKISIGLAKNITPLELSSNINIIREEKSNQSGINANLTFYSGYLGSKLKSMKAVNRNNLKSILNFYSSLTFFTLINFDQKYFHYERMKEFRPLNQIVNSLQENPFKYSGSLASTFILINKNLQRVGSVNFRIGDISLGYFNDGPPFNSFPGLWTGDGEDRWFTGGGFIEYSDNEASYYWYFERFTGYDPIAFKASSILGLTHTLYAEEQQEYNIGSTGLGLKTKGFDITANILGNDKLDLQNFIHKYLTANPIHYSNSRSNFLLNINYSTQLLK